MSEHQRDVAAWHLERWGRPPDPTLTTFKLVSEVGELCDAVLAVADDSAGLGTGKGDVADEIGDVFTLICGVAEAFGLDAEQCARSKFARSKLKHAAQEAEKPQ